MYTLAAMSAAKAKFNLRIEQELIDLLDDLRQDEEGYPSRAELIRRLIRRAAAAKAAKAAKAAARREAAAKPKKD